MGSQRVRHKPEWLDNDTGKAGGALRSSESRPVWERALKRAAVSISDAPCDTPETNTTLQISCTLVTMKKTTHTHTRTPQMLKRQLGNALSRRKTPAPLRRP